LHPNFDRNPHTNPQRSEAGLPLDVFTQLGKASKESYEKVIKKEGLEEEMAKKFSDCNLIMEIKYASKYETA